MLFFKQLLRAGVLAVQRSDNNALREALDRIPFESVENHAHNLMQVALWRGELGLPDALSYAYRARRLGFDDAEIGYRYFYFWQRYVRDDDSLYAVEAVVEESAVKLQWHDETQEYLVTRFPTGDAREIAPDDPRAQRLMGHRQGDVVRLRDDLGGTEHRVAEVKDKHLHALHESFETFASGRLQHSAFVVARSGSPVDGLSTPDPVRAEQPFDLRAAVQAGLEPSFGVDVPRLKPSSLEQFPKATHQGDEDGEGAITESS